MSRSLPDVRLSVRNPQTFSLGGPNYDIDFALLGPDLEALGRYAEAETVFALVGEQDIAQELEEIKTSMHVAEGGGIERLFQKKEHVTGVASGEDALQALRRQRVEVRRRAERAAERAHLDLHVGIELLEALGPEGHQVVQRVRTDGLEGSGNAGARLVVGGRLAARLAGHVLLAVHDHAVHQIANSPRPLSALLHAQHAEKIALHQHRGIGQIFVLVLITILLAYWSQLALLNLRKWQDCRLHQHMLLRL